MSINKEQLEKRLLALRKSLENTQATGNALIGAIQDCEYWLSQIKIEEQVEDK